MIGGDLGSRYRIRYANALNVDEFDDDGTRLRRWCFVPKGDLPIGDILLAQKTALELFEREAPGWAAAIRSCASETLNSRCKNGTGR